MIRYATFLSLLFLWACGSSDEKAERTEAPVQGAFTPATPILPQEPIPYPPALFASGIEGEVILYLVVDANGAVIHDSTRIAKSSGQTAFDAAAMQAAPSLRFTPAHRGDTAVQAPIQVPIHFTRPDSASQPGTP